MKARIKATGEIVEINESATIYDAGMHQIFNVSELEYIPDTDIDYWARLEHQAAIAVMQGIVSNSEMFIELGNKRGLSVENAIAEASIKVAHALVEKLKEN